MQWPQKILPLTARIWMVPIILAAAAAESNVPATAAGSGTWTLTGSLSPGREAHTATLLPNGNVVVTGGETNTAVTVSTRVYNPATGLWKVSGNLTVARAAHQAVLLPAAKILAAGGCVGICQTGNTSTAEIYNAVAGTWAKTAHMITARDYFGMVVLLNGKVLAVGGCTGQNANGCTGVTAAAEIYDPATGRWSSTGPLRTARASFTTTLLPNGKVLVAGGTNAAGNPIRTAELYNPATGLWGPTGAMNQARDEHTATLLPNGKVLVAGGENGAGVSAKTSELYDPTLGTWSLTGNLRTGRLEHTAALLGNGTVLVSGGNLVTTTTTTVLLSAELYNPTTGVWSTTGNMNARRVDHTSTVLMSGLVLNAAGSGPANELASAETYQP